MADVVKPCEQCGCRGNSECGHPPIDFERCCALDDNGVCGCCRRRADLARVDPDLVFVLKRTPKSRWLRVLLVATKNNPGVSELFAGVPAERVLETLALMLGVEGGK